MAVFDAVSAELERLKATETVEGSIAMRLAEQLDEPRNGMAVAGDAKELRTVISALRELIPAKADPVDDLLARRAARNAASKAV